jgi:SSS family solute:Na+ symporter
VFLLGLFWKRINAHGAFWGLVTGFILGVGKLTLQTLAKNGALADGTALKAIGDFNGYYFAGVLFVFSVVFVTLVSLATPAPSEEKVRGLTRGSVAPGQSAEHRPGWFSAEVLGTVVVLGLVLAMYIYFTLWLS